MTTHGAATADGRTQHTVASMAAEGRADLPNRLGWSVIWAVTGVVFASWLPQVWSVLGDNHLGRTAGRMALQIRNLQELGLSGSSWGANWEPYSPNAYAHHPPLATILDAIFGLPPGFGAYEVVLPQVLLALLAIPAGAFLLRALGIRWVPTLLAVGLMVVTVYYWAFGPVTFDVGLLLALPAVIVYLRNTPDPSRLALVGGAVVAVLTTLASWPGIAIAAVLGVWLFAKRRFDRVTIIIGASMVLGVLVSLGYMIGVNGLGELTNQAESRTTDATYTFGQYLRRQYEFGTAGLPAWYLALMPFALWWGLRDRRTRFVMALLTLFAAGWVLVLNNGSFIHSYWAYAVLLPGLVGMGALLDWSVDRFSPTLVRIGATAVGAVLAVSFGVMVLGPIADTYVNNPLDAGRLVSRTAPGPGQQYAWDSRVPAPRWFSFYWDLPSKDGTLTSLTEVAKPTDLMLVGLDDLPSWLPPSIGEKAVAREGNYVLVRVSDVLAAAQSAR